MISEVPHVMKSSWQVPSACRGFQTRVPELSGSQKQPAGRANIVAVLVSVVAVVSSKPSARAAAQHWSTDVRCPWGQGRGGTMPRQRHGLKPASTGIYIDDAPLMIEENENN